MNFADFGLGTWHPKGGMYQVIKAMTSLATELGVKIHTNSPVDKILVKNNKCVGIICKEKNIACDIVVSGADYHHSESLLDEDHRQYPESYWNKKTFAPSSLLFYIGFNKKLKNVEHHNLFFDTDFETHSKEIYDTPQWPSAPLFYANFPSISDTGMAPENCETGFFLVPIAPDLKDTPKLREQYFTIIMDRFELRTGQEIKNNILFMETFCVNDFKEPVQFIQGKCLRYGKHPFANRFLKARTKKQKSKALVFYGSTYSARPGGTPFFDLRKISF